MASGPFREIPVSGRLLARNTLLTLSTRGATLILGLLFVPLMIQSLGMELYGLLGLTWLVLGHLAWMELGFSAACVQFVSRSLAREDRHDAAGWVWTSVTAQTVVGVFGAAVLWLAAPSIAGALHVHPDRLALAVLTLRLLGMVVPVELVTRSFNAVLEVAQRFDYVNALTLLGSFWTYGAYGLCLLSGGSFLVVVYALAAQRVVLLIATAIAAHRILPELALAAQPESAPMRLRAKQMLGYGGWVTLNAGLGPLLLYFDRWLMGVMLGVAALPLFTVPFNLIMQLTLIPASLTATLFPAFSAMRARGEWARAEDLYVRSHTYLIVVLLPLLCGLFAWAPELLRLWVGAEFAMQATPILRFLVSGLFVGLLAPVSGAILNGAGRPDLLAKIYLVELPLNVVMMWTLVRAWGLEGAAAGYALRTIVETVVLWLVVHRALWVTGLSAVLRRAVAPAAVLGMLTALLWRPSVHSLVDVGGTLLVAAVYAFVAHRFLLDARARVLLLGMLGRSPSGPM